MVGPDKIYMFLLSDVHGNPDECDTYSRGIRLLQTHLNIYCCQVSFHMCTLKEHDTYSSLVPTCFYGQVSLHMSTPVEYDTYTLFTMSLLPGVPSHEYSRGIRHLHTLQHVFIVRCRFTWVLQWNTTPTLPSTCFYCQVSFHMSTPVEYDTYTPFNMILLAGVLSHEYSSGIRHLHSLQHDFIGRCRFTWVLQWNTTPTLPSTCFYCQVSFHMSTPVEYDTYTPFNMILLAGVVSHEYSSGIRHLHSLQHVFIVRCPFTWVLQWNTTPTLPSTCFYCQVSFHMSTPVEYDTYTPFNMSHYSQLPEYQVSILITKPL
jgi:hypothetical protein